MFRRRKWCVLLLAALVVSGENATGSRAADPDPARPDGAPRLISQLGHSRGFTTITFSPDGRLVLTASEDGTARLWEAASGRELRAFEGHSARVNAAVFSPDGSLILTGGEDETRASVRLWEAATGKQVRRITGPWSGVHCVAFSPDGRKIMAAVSAPFGGAPNYIWDAVTGKELLVIKGGSPVAFSPDGLTVVAGIGLWDAATGKELRRFQGHLGVVTSVAFSPDGRQLLTGSRDKTARLWDVATGKEVRSFEGHSGDVTSVAISPYGGRVLTAGEEDCTARLWDAATGEELCRYKSVEGMMDAVAFSPDGRRVLLGAGDLTLRLLDADTGAEVRRFEGGFPPVPAVAFSADGRRILTAGNYLKVAIWDTDSGKEVRRLTGHSNSVLAVALSSDGRQALTGSMDQTARLWEVSTGKELRRFEGHRVRVCSVAFSPDGNRVLTGSMDQTARLWDTTSGKEIHRFGGHASWVQSVAFSPDGRWAVTAGGDRMVRVWDVASGEEVRRFDANFFRGTWDARSVACSPDGTLVAAAGHSTALLWDVATGEELHRFHAPFAAIYSVMFSPDGGRLLTGGHEKAARLWDTVTGTEVRRFDGHSDHVHCVAFSSDGRWVLTGDSNSARLWEAQSGKALCRFVSYGDGTWTVIDSEGRFDSNDVDVVRGMHWVVPDDPFRALPPEIFLRDYYEPRLLARILAVATFKPVRSLAALNRVQPAVKIVKVEPQPDHPGEVTVSVEVAEQTATLQREGKPTAVRSGAFDLQLFRDGQLVGSHPGKEGPVPLDPKEGKATVRFEHVQLPRTAGTKKVEFSAYAFNADRVKSDTHRFEHPLPADLAPRKGTAYLICVGVNAFDSPDWDLTYAVPDARALADTLGDRLSRGGQFEKVVVVRLLATAGTGTGPRVFTEKSATKDNLRTALAALSGQKIEAEALKQVRGGADLGKARPEDLVLLSFSTHGYNGKDGQFYLFPADIGAGQPRRVGDALLRKAISSEELSLWLRDVDAGEMVMIVDACHSAASVAQEGFKPGPMGSRGLGQIAYNKRMRILAASQASDVAFEDRRIGHGLLTYALCREGLEQGQADFQPQDKRILLGEWLRFGEQRVPLLADQIATGKLRAVSLTGRDLLFRGLIREDVPEVKRRAIAQQPSLFDFTRGRDQTVLQTSPP